MNPIDPQVGDTIEWNVMAPKTTPPTHREVIVEVGDMLTIDRTWLDSGRTVRSQMTREFWKMLCEREA